MRALRNAAAAVLGFEIILFVLGGAVLVGRLPFERLPGMTPAELWSSVAFSVVFQGIAVYQILRERPGALAWITALFSALVAPGLLRVVGIIPLVYLVARITQRFWRKEPTPPPLPPDAASEPAATGQPAQTSSSAPQPGEGSAVLETVIGFVALFLHGMAWSAAPAWLKPAIPENAGSLGGGWIAFFLALTVSVFFHELGHAIGGASVGFRMARFVVYPFDYARTTKNRYFRLNFKTPVSGLYMGFPKTLENLEARMLWMTACGPLGGIAYSVCCWLVLWLANGSITGIAFNVLYTSMTYCLVTNLLNLVPLKSGGLRLDGRVLWDAIFDRQASEATVAMLGCTSSLRSDLRPRDWPAHWIEQLRRHPQDALAASLLAASAEDRLTVAPTDPDARKDLDLSADSLAKLVEALKDIPGARSSFEFHRAWLRCRYAGEKVPVDFAAAQADKETDPHEILRLQAALLAADGDSTGAVNLLHQAEAYLASAVKHGIDAADLDGLRAFREELVARVPAQS